METGPPLSSNTIIDSILVQYPKLAEVFNQHGMACVGCVFSRFHTLADAAAIYHLDVDRLIGDLSQQFSSLYDSEVETP